MKVRIELDMDWGDIRTLDMIANQLGLDPEATIRFLIRKGIESLIRPPEQQNSELVGTEIEVPEKGGDKK